jgi:REP element-mobilizing transposase RayT
MLEEEFSTFQRRLPQWRLRGGVYFVTWRLTPSHAKLSFADREAVAGAVEFFNGTRYHLFAYVVMDDHIHVLVQPGADHSLSSILHSWKSFTAHELNKQSGRGGRVWQEDNYTRIIRDESELQAVAEYIQGNPFKRWPDVTDYPFMKFFSP